MVFLTIFHELVMLQSLELLNYHCARDTIHANEQTKYVNCGLHLNFWNIL